MFPREYYEVRPVQVIATLESLNMPVAVGKIIVNEYLMDLEAWLEIHKGMLDTKNFLKMHLKSVRKDKQVIMAFVRLKEQTQNIKIKFDSGYWDTLIALNSTSQSIQEYLEVLNQENLEAQLEWPERKMFLNRCQIIKRETTEDIVMLKNLKLSFGGAYIPNNFWK